MDPQINDAIERAVNLVNTHAGQTNVSLRFQDDPVPIDFIANGASFQGGTFEFQAGFETYSGRLDELQEIRSELIS